MEATNRFKAPGGGVGHFDGFGETSSDIGLQINPEKLEVEKEVDVLLTKRDAFFKKEDVDEAFDAWLNFPTFHRTEGMTMEQYIVKHDHGASVASKYKLEVPDAVHAYIRLSNAGLEPSERALVLASAGIPVSKVEMASALRRIYGAKQEGEAIFVREAKEHQMRDAVSGVLFAIKRPKEERSRSSRGESRTNIVRRRKNPLRNGKRLLCSLCESGEHLMYSCSMLKQLREMASSCKEVNVVGASQDWPKAEYDINDSFFGYIHPSYEAILKLRASVTVAGREALLRYRKALRQKGVVLRMYLPRPSGTAIRFGSGEPRNCIGKVFAPVPIDGTRGSIKTEVVEGKRLILLGRSTM